jgi:hypothetical protein
MAGTGAATAAGGHRHAPVGDSVYTATGLPADGKNELRYPLEAVCECGEVICCAQAGQSGWTPAGRRADGS